MIRLGAIRWDNWAGSGHDRDADATVACMSPAKWHGRVPFCGKVLNETAVDFRCATREAMEQELGFAKRAGIDYWAFVQYSNSSGLSLALGNYLAVEPRSVNFSIIIDGNTLPKDAATTGPSWEAFLARYDGYFARSDYETVLGKPLVFWFMSKGQATSKFGSVEKFRMFADAWAAASAKEPYFVLMEGYDSDYVKAVGMPSRSAYALGDGLINGTFEKQRSQCLDRWNMWACEGNDVLPLAALGWDPRPRANGCAPWTPSGEGDSWTQAPTPADVVGAIQDAIGWACGHSSESATRHILAYAWNENSEGGWLVPTLGEGDARIKALESARAGKPWTCGAGDLRGMPHSERVLV